MYVSYYAVSFSALAGEDFIASNGTLIWLAGDVQPKSFNVLILANANPETTEMFEIRLNEPSTGSSIGAPATVLVTIFGHVPPGVGTQITIQMFMSTPAPGSEQRKCYFLYCMNALNHVCFCTGAPAGLCCVLSAKLVL